MSIYYKLCCNIKTVICNWCVQCYMCDWMNEQISQTKPKWPGFWNAYNKLSLVFQSSGYDTVVGSSTRYKGWYCLQVQGQSSPRWIFLWWMTQVYEEGHLLAEVLTQQLHGAESFLKSFLPAHRHLTKDWKWAYYISVVDSHTCIHFLQWNVFIMKWVAVTEL